MRKKLFPYALALFVLIANATYIRAQTTIQYFVREPKVKSAKPPLLILLHGYGSNEQDLFSFANQLPDKYLIVSARAPITLAEKSYAWYSIDFSKTPYVINFSEEEKSRKLLVDFISGLKSKYLFDAQQVYLCGFSQGAIMSYSVALTHPGLVRGIAALSGRLLDEIKPMIASKEKLKPLKVFILHGTNDQRIPVQDARTANAYLKTLGINAIYKEYTAGHEINREMLNALVTWLK